MIVGLRPISFQTTSIAEAEGILCSGREPPHTEIGSRDEYGVVITRANELIRSGDLEEARQFIKFALTHYKAADESTVQALDTLNATLG
jgi:hypothetical protein